MKTCPTCKQEKPREEFNKARRRKDGLYFECRGCQSVRASRYYLVLKTNPELFQARNRAHKNTILKRKYGLTLLEFEALLQEQEGRCQICKVSMDSPCVDHCHKTREVRGLLCRNCNVGVGYLEHSIPNLRSAIAYLSAEPEEPVAATG